MGHKTWCDRDAHDALAGNDEGVEASTGCVTGGVSAGPASGAIRDTDEGLLAVWDTPDSKGFRLQHAVNFCAVFQRLAALTGIVPTV